MDEGREEWTCESMDECVDGGREGVIDNYFVLF